MFILLPCLIIAPPPPPPPLLCMLRSIRSSCYSTASARPPLAAPLLALAGMPSMVEIPPSCQESASRQRWDPAVLVGSHGCHGSQC